MCTEIESLIRSCQSFIYFCFPKREKRENSWIKTTTITPEKESSYFRGRHKNNKYWMSDRNDRKKRDR